MIFPTLKETIKLNEFASRIYRYLEPQEYIGKLAPSLGMIIEKDLDISHVIVSEEFLDTAAFISLTYFREPLLEALKAVNTSLQKIAEAIPVIPLTHAMGLGKTHFLTLLYHLYTKAPHAWINIEKYAKEQTSDLLHKTNYKLDVAKRTLIIALDLKHTPANIPPYQALFFITLRIFRKYKAKYLLNEVPESKIKKFEEFLEEAHMYAPKEAAQKFVSNLLDLAITIPVLIIVDELYAGVFEAVEGASPDTIDNLRKTIMFLTAIIDELRGKVPAILVYASAMQDVLRWRNIVKTIEEAKLHDKVSTKIAFLNEAVRYFEDRTSRVMPISVRDVNEEEALEITKKRILEFTKPLTTIHETADFDALYKALREVIGEIEARAFIEELKRTYPFSPAYRELVKKLINPSYSSDFVSGKLQHLRDLIKISSTVIARIIEKTGERDWFISIAHVDHNDLKHLLDEGYANEWGKVLSTCREYAERVKRETNDPTLSRIFHGLLSSIYVKSVTNNGWDVINILTKSPESLTAEDLDKRALFRNKLIMSVIGIDGIDGLRKVHDALRRLEMTPYVQVIERSDGSYYMLSFLTNPYQLLRSAQEEELNKFVDVNGKLNLRKAIDYLREKLEEYALVSTFKEKSPLNIEFSLINDFKGDKPRFLNYLNKEHFTILILSPINVAEEILLKSYKVNIVEKIKEAVSKHCNDIKSLNMFAIVVPEVSGKSLERIMKALTEIVASSLVIDMLKTSKRRREFAERVKRENEPLLKLIPDIRSEEYFKEIILEILENFRRKLENYAQQLSNAAVQDFISEFLSLFKYAISYDSLKGNMEVYVISVRPGETVRKLPSFFASFPVWLSTTLSGKLKIKDVSGIQAELINWLKKEAVKKEELLLKHRPLEYYIDSIIECFRKGWSEIPIKPVSIKAAENAIKALAGREIPLDSKTIVVDIDEKEKLITVRLKIRLPPPPSPPVAVKGITITGVDNVLVGLVSINMLKQYSRTFDLQIEGKESYILVKGPVSKLIDVTKTINRYINKYRNDITYSKLHIEFIKPLEKEKAVEIIKQTGLPLHKVKFDLM